MATKEKLLSLLQSNQGTYLSGQELANTLGVSRASVWKAVKALQNEGCTIDAVTNKGYCLTAPGDLLSPEKISDALDCPFWQLKVLKSLPSTNSFLRDLANQGAPEGTVILAQQQTAGRGRMGRSFYSPAGTGLYLSLLLRPSDLSPAQSLQITTMAAAAACQAIEEVTGLSPQIKWVNDLFLNGRKICGILTEASLNLETGHLDYAVLGLGLNLYAPEGGFPENLQEIAGALASRPVENLKNSLTAAFLNHFYALYSGRHFREAAELYRSRSLLIGKQVSMGDSKTPATVLDVNDRCQLVVRLPGGEIRALSYGEVSIVNYL